MRVQIFYKLLAVLLISFSGLILLLILVINSSFRDGFADYLVEQEQASVLEARQRLANYYQQAGSWQALAGNPRLWRRLLESDAIPFPAGLGPSGRGGFPPPPGGTPGGGFQPPPPRGEPGMGPGNQPLHRRLILADKERVQLFGPPVAGDEVRWTTIDIDGVTVGWFGLIPLALEADSLAQQFVNQQRNNMWAIALSAVLVVLLVSALLARLLVRPVTRVTEAAGELAEGDLGVRVSVQGRDELAQLSESFNRMAAKLQQSEKVRQQWLMDVSHELRTPIAVLGGEIEALVDGIRQPSPQRIASLHNEIRALARLVEDLHQLSLSDQQAMNLQFAEVDLQAVCQQLGELFEPRMAAASLGFSMQLNDGQRLLCEADRQRLRQVITNLLENSLRYTDAGGEVTLTLAGDRDWLQLELKDTAPGVPDTMLPQIFERLYRVDKSRSRSMGGSGLGLSICRTIIEAHGGDITASSWAGGGLHLAVRLPVRQAAVTRDNG